MKFRKKLIEVSLPLEAINDASAKEKSIRQGHPSTLHLWWARRPLASARAVIFGQMVDDPSSHPDIFPTEKLQELERQRLFRIIEDLVKWENTNNEAVLSKAREEILKSWISTCKDNASYPLSEELFNIAELPGLHDPFAGGGAIPLEAQRLGLNSFASDLNPVPVMINKAMIEIPPVFKDMPPVNSEWANKPDPEKAMTFWKGTQGLAYDLNYYGQWIKDKAESKVGNLYPKVTITKEMLKNRPDLEKYLGQQLTVISWLWARTVKSPNPAFSSIDVPLVSSFMLSTKPGKEVYVNPEVESSGYKFTVKVGKPGDIQNALSGTKLARGANFKCLMSNAPISSSHIKAEGKAGRMGSRLMAIVLDGDRERIYLSPTYEQEEILKVAKPEWEPNIELVGKCRDQLPLYGMNTFSEIFTPRQLATLTTFSDLVKELRGKVLEDALKAGLLSSSTDSEKFCKSAQSYANAIAVYISCALGKLSDYNSTACSWISGGQTMRNTFGRQAITMTWDYAEANIFSSSTGSFVSCLNQVHKVVSGLPGSAKGESVQNDAQSQSISQNKVVSTDPPYYDNICYADLSDYFYVWLRHSLKEFFPKLFSTLAVPKAEELVATQYRHGTKELAEKFFLEGMTLAMGRISDKAHPAFPVTIYYAFKQAESDGDDGTTNTGWDTFLAAVIQAGFEITGTWPMRTEMSNRMVGSGANALASSIVLVCRKRDANARSASRREFMALLKDELPKALALLQAGNIAPVDLAQAAIGPGMAVYTRFSNVLDADGNQLSVRSALSLINQTLDESLAEQEGDFDSDTRWALTWFDQNGFSEGDYGAAEQLSKSKNTAVNGLVDAGILFTRAGKVRLLKPFELPDDWDPKTDNRLTVWEIVHHLVRVLEKSGEIGASEILAKLGSKAEIARELCYRLYTLCERKKRANEAMSYNSLVQSWVEINRLAREKPISEINVTQNMFDQDN